MSHSDQFFAFPIATEIMQEGRAVRRELWPSGWFVFMQKPAQVPAETVPKMTSLPEPLRTMMADLHCPLHYQDQFALVQVGDDVIVRGWSPQPHDILAMDWEVTVPKRPSEQ